MWKESETARHRGAGRWTCRGVVTLLAVGLVALGGLSRVCLAGQPVTLTYASFASADGPHAQAFKYVADEMTKRTNGRVTFRGHYSSSLVGFNEMIEALQDGRADITLFLPVQAPRSFPLSTVASVLFVTNDTWAHSQAFTDLYEIVPRFASEWKAQRIVPLWFASIGPAVLGARTPVDNLEWLKNKSIRSTGYFTQALRVVGANPVAIPNSDVFEAIGRGVIDAFYASTIEGAALDNRHFEVTTDWRDLGAGEYTAIVTAISQRALDKLTADEQKMLFSIAADLRKVYYTKYYLPLMDKACTLAMEGGLKSLKLWPKAETEKFRQIAAPVVLDRWIQDVKAAGIAAEDAKGFYDQFVKAVREKEKASPVDKTVTARCADRFAARK